MIALLLLLTGCPHGEPLSAHVVDGGRVVMWAMNQPAQGRPECEWPVEPTGELCGAVREPGVSLTADQVERLLAILDSPGSYGVPRAKCFAPYHGVGVFDAQGELRSQVALSFACEGLRAQPELRAHPAAEAREGLSASALEGLLALCEEVGLPGCVAAPPR